MMCLNYLAYNIFYCETCTQFHLKKKKFIILNILKIFSKKSLKWVDFIYEQFFIILD